MNINNSETTTISTSSSSSHNNNNSTTITTNNRLTTAVVTTRDSTQNIANQQIVYCGPYKLDKTLGKGQTGLVFLIISRKNNLV